MSKKRLAGASSDERAEWARQVRGLRQAKGWKQDELAELAGVTRQTISNMERGVTPQEDVLRRVLDVLGVETDGGEFEPQTEMWLTMMGTLIETMPIERRPPAVNAAVRVLADGVRDSGATITRIDVRGRRQPVDLHTVDWTGEEAASTDQTPVDPDSREP